MKTGYYGKSYNGDHGVRKRVILPGEKCSQCRKSMEGWQTCFDFISAHMQGGALLTIAATARDGPRRETYAVVSIDRKLRKVWALPTKPVGIQDEQEVITFDVPDPTNRGPKERELPWCVEELHTVLAQFKAATLSVLATRLCSFSPPDYLVEPGSVASIACSLRPTKREYAVGQNATKRRRKISEVRNMFADSCEADQPADFASTEGSDDSGRDAPTAEPADRDGGHDEATRKMADAEGTKLLDADALQGIDGTIYRLSLDRARGYLTATWVSRERNKMRAEGATGRRIAREKDGSLLRRSRTVSLAPHGWDESVRQIRSWCEWRNHLVYGKCAFFPRPPPHCCFPIRFIFPASPFFSFCLSFLLPYFLSHVFSCLPYLAGASGWGGGPLTGWA